MTQNKQQTTTKLNGTSGKDHPHRKLYVTYYNLLRRCNNPLDKDYKFYGQIGIKSEFIDFDHFYQWSLMNGWSANLTIDRINNSGNYSPSNCCFIPQTEQTRVGKRKMFGCNKSGYTGVYYKAREKKYKSQITIAKKQIHLGLFTTAKEAAQARVEAEIFYFGRQLIIIFKLQLFHKCDLNAFNLKVL
jgi:hypothetical protein